MKVVLVDGVRDYAASYAPCLYPQLGGFGYSATDKGYHVFRVWRDEMALLGVKAAFKKFQQAFFKTVAVKPDDLPPAARGARATSLV